MRSDSGIDEREWLELAAGVMAAPLVELPVERIGLQLVRTFDAVGAAFCLLRNGRVRLGGLYPVGECFGGHRSEIENWGVRHAPRVHPVLRYARATGTCGFLQVADVPERLPEPGVVAAWYERTRRWGCADQLVLPLLVRDDEHRAFVVGRDAPFTGGELEFARRVWQLLVGLDRQVQAFGALRVVPEVGSHFRLTPRELKVLELLVEGLTAGAIGRRLAIGERTVQKHLEHAYTKLGVGDRLSAVLRAQQLGLLPMIA